MQQLRVQTPKSPGDPAGSCSRCAPPFLCRGPFLLPRRWGQRRAYVSGLLYRLSGLGEVRHMLAGSPQALSKR